MSPAKFCWTIFMEEKLLTMEELTKLYPKLSAKLSEEAIQIATKEQTKKGYDTTGYGYQYIVNRMNEVLGPSHWRQIVEIVKEVPKGDKLIEVTMRVTVQIGNWINGTFIPIAEQVAFGGHASMTLSDAYKGAHTNTLKKALGMFGVGKEAYEGTLDDDNRAPDFREKMKNASIVRENQNDFSDFEEFEEEEEEKPIKAKLLEPIQVKKSKQGTSYGTAKIVTKEGEVLQLVVFGKELERIQNMKPNQIITIIGEFKESPVNGRQLIAKDFVA
ncbi:Rad52/Rad22 family DNA repair protein [Thermoanaerobacter thermohydrosulfuricus]